MIQVRQSKAPTVVTIGNFDGVHLGHLELIEKTISIAKKEHLRSLVCSFNSNTKGAQILVTNPDLQRILRELHVSLYSSLPFFQKIIDLSCEEFVAEYLCQRFRAKYVVVGEDFRFGKQRSGDTETLKQLGKIYGFEVIVVPMIKVEGKILSSTLIRELIRNGNVKEANQYMYRPFTIGNTVQEGYTVGSQLLKLPTANFPIPPFYVPLPFGAYHTETVVDGRHYQSITNVGYAPTYPKTEPMIETHLFCFSGNLYEKYIEVRFLEYIREERKFSSMEELKKQIDKDIEKCMS